MASTSATLNSPLEGTAHVTRTCSENLFWALVISKKTPRVLVVCLRHAEESSNSLPEKEVESTTSTQQQTTVQTNQIADASTHRVPDEIEVFNQRQVARLVSPFARAIEAKSDATAFQRRLRAMSLSTNSTNGSEPNKPNTRSSISKSRSRTRLASDSYVGYSSDSEVTSHSPSINRSEKPLSALAAEKAGSQTSSSSWYGSLKRRSRRSNSDLQNTAEEPTVKLGASTPSVSCKH